MRLIEIESEQSNCFGRIRNQYRRDLEKREWKSFFNQQNDLVGLNE